MDTSPLDTELSFFDRERRAWIAQGLAGKWVCICGSSLVGMFDSDEAAFEAGVRAVGATIPFLVKQLLAEEPRPSHSTLCMGALGA